MKTQSIAAVRADARTRAGSRLMVGHVLLGLLVTSGATWVSLIGAANLVATRVG